MAKISESVLQKAKEEIAETLSLATFVMRFIGVSFTEPKDPFAYFRLKLLFAVSIFAINYHVFGDILVIVIALKDNPKIEEIIPLFHVCGYAALSIAKVSVLWYKKDVFAKLIDEMATMWPGPPLQNDIQCVKDKSLSALKIASKWYFYSSTIGVWFYNFTPIVVYLHRMRQGDEDAQIGFVWLCWYPFDKTTPVNHVIVYLFEIYSGLTCVWIMVSTDLLFTAMASNLCFLLRVLQKRLLSLAKTQKSDDAYYADIMENINIHQRLIRYCADIEEAFTVVNLINVILSSVTICCVMFVIVLLEPLLDIRNKFFLVSALLQIFVLCYYADDIIYASKEVGDAAYDSGWYRTNPRCRRALIFLILRSQKPIAFTAMKFTNISLVTFTSILTRSYSYFALLYTMFSEN